MRRRFGPGLRPRVPHKPWEALYDPAGSTRSGGGPARHEPENDELSSPYVEDGVLDLRAWARDALALTLPANVLCRVDCAGLPARSGM